MKAKEISRLKPHDKMLLASNGLNQQVLECDSLLGVTAVSEWPKHKLSAEEQDLIHKVIDRCELVLRRTWDGGKNGPHKWLATERLEKELEVLRDGLAKGGATG